MLIRSSVLLVAPILVSIGIVGWAEQVYRPVIDGPWWQVAGNPDLGEYTREKQQPVDFEGGEPELPQRFDVGEVGAEVGPLGCE